MYINANMIVTDKGSKTTDYKGDSILEGRFYSSNDKENFVIAFFYNLYSSYVFPILP